MLNLDHHQSLTHNLVLVVDDEPDVADSLALLVQAHGYEVLVAYGAAEAFRMAQMTRPATIVCDINMPRINGLQLARMLRADDQFKDVHLIALTASDITADVTTAAGFDRLLFKPLDFDADLRSLLEKEL